MLINMNASEYEMRFRHLPGHIQLILGPLLGLAFVIALPFIGLTLCILAIYQRILRLPGTQRAITAIRLAFLHWTIGKKPV